MLTMLCRNGCDIGQKKIIKGAKQGEEDKIYAFFLIFYLLSFF